MTLATTFLLLGFLLTVVGVACWSIPAACIVAGVVLFVAGGMDQAQRRAGQ